MIDHITIELGLVSTLTLGYQPGVCEQVIRKPNGTQIG